MFLGKFSDSVPTHILKESQLQKEVPIWKGQNSPCPFRAKPKDSSKPVLQQELTRWALSLGSMLINEAHITFLGNHQVNRKLQERVPESSLALGSRLPLGYKSQRKGCELSKGRGCSHSKLSVGGKQDTSSVHEENWRSGDTTI